LRNRLTVLLVTVVLLCSARPMAAQRGEKTEAPKPVVVLGSASYWRMHHTLAAPVVDAGGKLERHTSSAAWLNTTTSPAPADWTAPAFDDTSWLETPYRGGCQTPYLARQCVRGKFTVTNPSQVRGLSLSVAFHGGAVVYLNGKELTRGGLPAGAITPDTLAEGYPLDAHVTASGDLIADRATYTARGRRAGKPDADTRQRMASRVRRISDFAIPQAALRKGVNVLAIELLRAPYHKVLLETQEQAGGKNRHNKFDWYTCKFISAELTASGDKGLVPNAHRPSGLQVWNVDPMAGVGHFDYGDPCEPLGPIRLVGAKNGVFSGKVVVSSDKPIVGLKVTAGALRGPDDKQIPATAVRVRYGRNWGREAGFNRSGFFGAVVDAPPGEIPVRKVRAPLVGGAVMPVWVTVRTPRDIAAGPYTGTVTIRAAGAAPVRVPVRIDVADYALPDSQDYRTWVELIQSPDTLAVEYGLPLWSDKHFAMIARSFDLMRDSGTRVVHVPVIAHTNLGNAESMIRWIKTGEKSYDFDFSVMDRYLDLAQKHLGEPKIVMLQVWEINMCPRKNAGRRFGPKWDKRQESTGGHPLVTMLDRATGKTENVAAPSLADPASKAIWGKLLKEVRRRLRKRGIEKTLMLGMFTDIVPPKEHIEFFHALAPDVPWVQQGHGRWKTKVHGIADVGYQATVWGGYRFGDGCRQTNQKEAPIVASLHGWATPRLDVVFERNRGLDSYPSSRWRFYAETGITSELRGVGRIGADYWKVIKDRRNRRVGYVHERFVEGTWASSWIQLNLCSSTLAPGPGGPAATTRLLAMIEGIQECEARITIEAALMDKRLKARLGADLAKRCQRGLDERLHTMWKTLSNYQLGGPDFFRAAAWRWTAGVPGHRWYLSTGWQDASRRLYGLAGEVQRKLGPAAKTTGSRL
jgi:glycosyl hydrolase family 123